MKLLRYTAALTATLCLSLLVVGCGDKQANKLEKDIKAHYGESVTDINISSVSFGEASLYTIAATAKDGTEFSIDADDIKLNSYLKDYYEDYMADTAAELLKDSFKGKDFAVNVTIQADNIEFIPGGELIPYDKFMEEYSQTIGMRPRMNIKADLPHTSFTYTDFYRVAKAINGEGLVVTVLDVDFSDNFNYRTEPSALPANMFAFTPVVTEKTEAQVNALDSVNELNK